MKSFRFSFKDRFGIIINGSGVTHDFFLTRLYTPNIKISAVWFCFHFLFCLGSGKTNGEPDCETSTSAMTQSGLEEINPETKAKIEEEAYNKGWEYLMRIKS